jgi:hypothetical protein
MKKTIAQLTFVLLFFSFDSFSQTIKFTELTNDRGDKEDFKTYISKDDATYNVGDTIHILSPSVSSGKFDAIKCRIEGDNTYAVYPVESNMENNNIVIENIFATKGNASSPSKVIFQFKKKASFSETVFLYFLDIEKAIRVGEVKAYGMSSDEALAELKKAKDKLDLGVLTQNEYDVVKANLIKYIKK